jgi:hypothetical protein
MMQIQTDRVKKELRKLEAKHVDNQMGTFFFKWKLITAALKHFNRADIRKLMKIVSQEEVNRL